MKIITYFLAGITALVVNTIILAEKVDPDPSRFEKEIAKIVKWDSKNSFPEGAILFVGSSSIRLWPTSEAFPGKRVINRGFGGSEMSDLINYYDVLIKPYAPEKIFVYEGDNDIDSGKTPAQVLEDYKQLVGLIEKDYPGLEIVFISIKPSKSRWDKWPIMVEANNLIESYTKAHDNLKYVDVASVMLNSNGEPKDIFKDDDLHLNEEGYKLWTRAIEPYLETSFFDSLLRIFN